MKENQAFGAEETSTKVRVDGKAFVILPLKKDRVGELFAAKSLSCAPSCLQMYDTNPHFRGLGDGFVDIREDLFTFLFPLLQS